MDHDPQIKDFFLVFITSKNAPKSKKNRNDIFGVCWLIGNQILPHFDFSKFEIGPLEAKIFFFFLMLLESL